LLVSVKHPDPHPQKEDGDKGDNENHQESHCDPDEGRGIHAEGVVETVSVYHNFFLVLS
jgi:hypothetical protein